MRKRFVTTFLTCMLTLACIFSFTACGGNSDTPDGDVSKGEKVTEEQWKAAFEATVNSDNYTVEINRVQIQTTKLKENGKTATMTSTGEQIVFVNSESCYINTTQIIKETADEDFYDDEYQLIDETELWEIYNVIEDAIIWDCYYTGDTWWTNFIPCENNVEAKKYMHDSMNDIGSLIDLEVYLSKEDEEAKTISELYSAFEYSDGKYTVSAIVGNYEANITITIVDGYIVGLSMVAVSETDNDSSVETVNLSLTYEFKDYGNTTVPVPEGAIEDINKTKDSPSFRY